MFIYHKDHIEFKNDIKSYLHLRSSYRPSTNIWASFGDILVFPFLIFGNASQNYSNSEFTTMGLILLFLIYIYRDFDKFIHKKSLSIYSDKIYLKELNRYLKFEDIKSVDIKYIFRKNYFLYTISTKDTNSNDNELSKYELLFDINDQTELLAILKDLGQIDGAFYQFFENKFIVIDTYMTNTMKYAFYFAVIIFVGLNISWLYAGMYEFVILMNLSSLSAYFSTFDEYFLTNKKLLIHFRNQFDYVFDIKIITKSNIKIVDIEDIGKNKSYVKIEDIYYNKYFEGVVKNEDLEIIQNLS
jgi:hypothetical protein